MRTVTSGGQDQINSEQQNVCHALKITRKDLTVHAFTDFDATLVLAGTTYKSTTGFSLSELQTNGSASPTNQDIVGLIDDDEISSLDLMRGAYDGAEVEIFKVDYSVPEIICTLQYGIIGEITVVGKRFNAELRGLTQILLKTIGSSYSATCRAEFGDTKCTINKASHTYTGSLTSVSGRRIIAASALTAPATGYFNGGEITFTSGPNIGVNTEIKTWDNPTRTLELFLPLPFTPTVGDTFSAVRGCDKLFATCKNTFSNGINFRGEPFIPGMEKVMLPVRRTGAV